MNFQDTSLQFYMIWAQLGWDGVPRDYIVGIVACRMTFLRLQCRLLCEVRIWLAKTTTELGWDGVSRDKDNPNSSFKKKWNRLKMQHLYLIFSQASNRVGTDTCIIDDAKSFGLAKRKTLIPPFPCWQSRSVWIVVSNQRAESLWPSIGKCEFWVFQLRWIKCEFWPVSVLWALRSSLI